MQNPFAIAVQWPDAPRCYLVHLQRPYFTAALFERPAVASLFVNWSPGAAVPEGTRANLFRQAADFCCAHWGLADRTFEFIERPHGYHLPRFLMAQTAATELFIVEPEHAAPLVEVRKSGPGAQHSTPNVSHRFDVVTQWRLGEMRKYYQQYLERQTLMGNGSKLVAAH